jgi:pyruvate dehydrogenase kinase 2/3/4
MADEINKFAQYHPTTLTLQNFVDFGSKNASERKSFSFLRNELSVRLANIMKEICLLPEPLLVTPSVSQVEEWYEQSFEDMMKFQTMDPDASGTLSKFSEALDTILNRHSSVVEAMANGVMEMKEQLQCSAEIPSHVENCIQYFLDRFYMNRISIRMLIHQHLLLFTKRDRKKQYAEAIDVNCDIQSIVQDAYQNARFLCEQYYSKAPDCEIECHSPFIVNRAHNERIVMTYIPSHLHHMMFELMKNALRAVIEYHSGKSEQELPKVKVFICKGRKDMTIKLSDQGGGIRRSEVDLLFNYMYSTAPQPPSPDAADTTPIAGYGYGLPLSRLYAKYFNGNLWLNSVDGFGTDAMVCLKLLPQDASELLPIFNKTSFNKYMQPAQVGDWSDASNGFGRINSHNGHRL